MRSTESGGSVDWTKFMEISVNKEAANTIRFKYSHTDGDYEVLKIGEARRHSSHINLTEPQLLYPLGYRNIPEAKYQDLQNLCSGSTPVVVHPDHQMFFKQLRH